MKKTITPSAKKLTLSKTTLKNLTALTVRSGIKAGIKSASGIAACG